MKCYVGLVQSIESFVREPHLLERHHENHSADTSSRAINSWLISEWCFPDIVKLQRKLESASNCHFFLNDRLLGLQGS